MIATGTDYLALIEKMPPGTVEILSDVEWEEYEELLEELDERPGIRLTYDRGRLQKQSENPYEKTIPVFRNSDVAARCIMLAGFGAIFLDRRD
ncbi:MAG: hypothetical protein ACREEM_33810 [Blastocatellia bacterium]